MAEAARKLSFQDACPNALDTGARSDNRAAWLSARTLGWTASEVPALLGFDKRRSPLAVYAAKLGRAIEMHSDDDLELMRWGNRFEKPILEEYGERTGHHVEQVGALLQSRSHPFVLATLDGMDWTVGSPLEVKTFGWWVSQEWDAEPGEVPKAVFVQVQIQLAVTGAESIPVLALPLNERKLRVTPVKRHQGFIDLALGKLAEHWERLQRGHLPEPDAHETTRLALDALYANSNGDTVRLSASWPELTDEYEELNGVIRKSEKRKDLIKNQLRYELGEAGYGDVGDGRRWSLLDAAGPSHTCSSCGNVDRGKGSRRPKLSGKKKS
jgi:putative phage-type endonuclease